MRDKSVYLAVVLALATSVCLASAPAPRMTGERLLQRLEPVIPADIAVALDSKLTRDDLASLRTRSNVEFVQGYLDALYDATEGVSWCYDPTAKSPKPDTIWDESRWGLLRLPPGQLKQNAAELLVEIWKTKWPCQPGRRSKR